MGTKSKTQDEAPATIKYQKSSILQNKCRGALKP